MSRKLGFLMTGILASGLILAQKGKEQQRDTSFADYEVLFSELEHFLDSLIAPRNFAIIDLSIAQGYFNYEHGEDNLTTSKKMLYSPSASYFLKSGFGVSASAAIVNDGQKINPYQYNISGSYDYMKKRTFITGLSLTRFFTKNNLPFYTPPLQNDVYAYFMYRNLWIKPSIAVSYGWGSRSEYAERETYLHSAHLRPDAYTHIDTRESINDFNLMASIRHDFYWLNVCTAHDFIKVTPQLIFISGTQKFGFNQISNTYATMRGTGVHVLYNSENVYLDNKMIFQPLSLTGLIKTEYYKGKLFIQPQLLCDYYFPAKTDKLSLTFLLNAGVIL